MQESLSAAKRSNAMKIELKAIKIKDLVEGFKDDEEAGVVGFGG